MERHDGTSDHEHLPPTALADWLGELAPVLGIDAQVDVGAVLDVARDAAHGVARPAGPLTTFAVGLAAGRRTAAGEPLGPVLAELTDEVRTLVARRAAAGDA
jgi:hypothetical protein